MIKARTVVGVCVLCALALDAVAVQSAAAATNGTTGFTCKEKKEPGGVGFSKAHCRAADAVATGAKFDHVEIPEGLTTEGRVTNTGTEGEEKPVAVLQSTQAGIALELQAKQTEGIASGLNTKTVAGEHFIEGTGATTYSEVTVTKPQLGCKVEGGKVVTNTLKGTSLGTGMEGKLEPAAGNVFAKFTIEGCSKVEFNGTYEVTGSIRCPGDGATVLCSEANTTAQNTLKLRGQKAGIGVTTTATGRKNSSEPFTPLAVTTVETP